MAHMVVLVLVFEKSPYCFPQWLHQFTFPPARTSIFKVFNVAVELFLGC